MTHTQNNYSRRCRRGWCFECSSMALSLILIIFIIQTGLISSTTVIQPETEANAYLIEYDYLDPQFNNSQSDHLTAEEAMSKAIMEFQKFAGLNLTGYLDDDTTYMMSLPRCGVRDILGSKKYSFIGGKWQTKDLTYKITKYAKEMDKLTVDSEIERAFKVWSDITPLNIRRKTNLPVHIEIRFEKYKHGDSDPFDGPGRTLGHAYFSADKGTHVHFDDDETWTIKTTRGTNLFQVAVHEFGHSLGLDHSDNRKAIMHAYYTPYQPNFQLHADDIRGIQALYGSRSKVSENDTPINDGSNALCKDSTFDAIFISKDGKTYVFKGPHYWELTKNRVAAGYPKMISENWIGLPDNIDTAFTLTNKTYFFKGTKYWIYDGIKNYPDYYPRNINDDFPGIPNDLQASMTWSGGRKIYLYFFKGDQYWVYDPSTQPPVKSTYPKLITESKGIPHDLDDAFRSTYGYVYFFKGGKYYRLNKKGTAVDTVDPPYPRDVGKYWFGCDD